MSFFAPIRTDKGWCIVSLSYYATEHIFFNFLFVFVSGFCLQFAAAAAAAVSFLQSFATDFYYNMFLATVRTIASIPSIAWCASIWPRSALHTNADNWCQNEASLRPIDVMIYCDIKWQADVEL